MKWLLANKLILVLIGGVIVVGVGAAVYFGVINNNSNNNNDSNTNNGGSTTNDDFQKMGQYSFGVDVCNEMTSEEVAKAIGKPIQKTKDYSNSGSTGCEYFVTENGFVIIDVGFGDMAKQKQGLELLERTIKTSDSIKLENMLVYSEKGLIDIYMNVAPGQKYVRVGRSSTTVVDESTLINLAIATEAKIRSFK